MIAPNETRQQKRHRERIEAKEKSKHGKDNMQTALNNVLWKIVMENGGIVKIPCEDLKATPAEAALQGKVIGENFVIKAMLRQPNIILPKNGLIV